MIVISNLDLFYQERILENANFVIQSGTVNGLFAKNGSGKTTLLRTIAGLRSEKHGEVQVVIKRKVLSFQEIRRAIFYFESSEWFDGNLSGLDYLRYYQQLWRSEEHSELERMVRFWEMDAYIKKPIKKYSLGMKQKLLLSLYAVSGAEYWLMDEPTIGLDEGSMDKFSLFLKEAKKQGKGILFSHHDFTALEENCETIFTLANKKISSGKGIKADVSIL